MTPHKLAGLLAIMASAACNDDRPYTPPENGPPVVRAQTLDTDEDTALEFDGLATATDLRGEYLRITSATTDGHAAVAIKNKRHLEVTPAKDFHGLIIVTYDVSDGAFTTKAYASVHVRSVNDRPVVGDATWMVSPNDAVEIVLTGSDVDGDSLSFDVLGRPSHGELRGFPPELRYVPDFGFVGEDTLTFEAHDGGARSGTATVHLVVIGGATPTAYTTSAFTREEAAVDLKLRASGGEAELRYEIVTAPAHGTLSGTAPHLIYTPAADFSGSDAMQFSVSDGHTSSPPANVSITVSPVNDAPVAHAKHLVIDEDEVVSLRLPVFDADQDRLIFELGKPSHGSINFLGQYTPEPNYHGPDSFTYTVRDATSRSEPATVTIDVRSVDDPPTGTEQAITVPADRPAQIVLAGSDVEGDAITDFVVEAPEHGVLTGTPPVLTYTPAPGYLGPDWVYFQVSAAGALSEWAVVSITVVAP